MAKKKNKTYCTAPFNSVTVEATGRLSLCCMSVADYTFPDGHKHMGQVGSVDEHFNGQYMDSVRSAMLAGKRLKECKVCYKQEAAGTVSDRQRHGWSRPLLTDGPEIKFVDFKLGNKCNLRCKMCWPHNSSELMKEWHDLGWTGDDDPMAGGREEFYEGYMQEDFAWQTRPENINKLLEVTHLLEHMKFTGGEPMLNPQLFRILQHCVDEGTAGGIDLRVITNCTKIHPRFLDLAKKFKSLYLVLSIDGVGRTYDYIRYPANWDDVLANAARYASWYSDGLVQGKLQVHSVVSVFNLHQIPELCRLVRTTLDGVQGEPPVYFLELDRPGFMDWRHAPAEVQERVKRESLDMIKSPDPKLSHMGKALGRMLSRQGGTWPTDDTHRQLREFVTQQDGIRGIDIADYVPHLVSTIRPL